MKELYSYLSENYILYFENECVDKLNRIRHARGQFNPSDFESNEKLGVF